VSLTALPIVGSGDSGGSKPPRPQRADMPALFSETWATRIAVERLKLALDSPISEDNADNQQTPEN